MSQNADSHPEPQPTLTTLESMETTLESIVQESTINNQEVTHITEAENTLEQVEEIQTIPELRNRKRSSYSHVYPKEPKETVNEQKDTPNTKDEVIFECNICLDTASNPVVTMCGHLYCWPCLNNWLKSGSPASNTCPVCKSGTSRESVIPIYCRGQDIKDPRYFVIYP